MRADAIVIGAGCAGLAAVVIEQAPRLGGRATSFTDRESGERVDNGQHALFGCYRETFAFLQAIGAEALVALDERLDLEIVDRHQRRSRLVTPSWTPPLHLVGGLMRWPALGVRD